MIVVDASALIETLLPTAAAEAVVVRLFDSGGPLAAPHLIDVEAAQVLRRCARAGEIDDRHGREALTDLADMPIRRYPHHPLLPRIWEVWHNFTAYDGSMWPLPRHWMRRWLRATVDWRMPSAMARKSKCFESRRACPTGFPDPLKQPDQGLSLGGIHVRCPLDTVVRQVGRVLAAFGSLHLRSG